MFSTTRGKTATWQSCCGVVGFSATTQPWLPVQTFEKLDTDERAYVWLPPMASTSGGQIGCLCAESFCERILSEANHVCHYENTLLDTIEINMMVVLYMNLGFIQHLNEI